jgi:MFS family permease
MSDQIQAQGGGAAALNLPTSAEAQPANAYRLLWAGFMAILASGIGFAIRAGILGAWARQYGFSFSEIGEIGGAGLTGFCFGIIIGGVVADKIGYGWLVIAAFLLHILSAVVTFFASDSVLTAGSIGLAERATTFNALYWGTFLFALANGTLEAVANPLVATLFPENRTHYLNILHASWPAGLVLGGICGWVLGEQYNVYWKDQLALFLVPTLLYGVLFLGQAMPQSEASRQGLSTGEMFKDVGILGGLVICFLLALFLSGLLKPLLTPTHLDDATEQVIKEGKERAAQYASIVGYVIAGALLVVIAFVTNFSFGSFLLFVLFIAHALVGAVELGTDTWITNITGNLLSTSEGRILFVFTSAVMFLLRFCSDFIEKRLGLTPVSLLFVCAVLACAGLLLASRIDTFLFALLALGVYAVGKTFFWPTMLAVASDRFPRTGAVAISMMGGIGMLSAGIFGSPGLGYAKDRFSGEALEGKPVFAKVKAAEPGRFPFLPEAYGIDPVKREEIQNRKKADESKEKGETAKPATKPVSVLFRVPDAVTEKEPGPYTDEDKEVFQASIEGDRRTLVADAAIPATMAVIYLGLMIYFWAIGGYKVLHIDGTEKEKAGH